MVKWEVEKLPNRNWTDDRNIKDIVVRTTKDEEPMVIVVTETKHQMKGTSLLFVITSYLHNIILLGGKV